MKLRFKIDQARLFKRGIDAPKSIVIVEVNPADLPQETRDLVSRHLEGIDVVYGGPTDSERKQLVVTDDPTFESLVKRLQEMQAAKAEAQEAHESLFKATQALHDPETLYGDRDAEDL